MKRTTTMSLRLDRAVSPPGVFRPSRCYSLVLRDGRLFVLYTGRGDQPAWWERVLSRTNAAGSNEARRQLNAAEVRLDQSDLDVLASEAHCFALRPADILEVTAAVRRDDVRLTIRSRKGKFDFRLTKAMAPTVEALRLRLLDGRG
jgi:hypothetical protein